VWQKIALFLAGMVVTGAVTWSTYVREAVTSSEVQRMIDSNNKTMQVQIDYLSKQYTQVNSKLDYIIQNPKR
jgi:uncharacterized membrane protein